MSSRCQNTAQTDARRDKSQKQLNFFISLYFVSLSREVAVVLTGDLGLYPAVLPEGSNVPIKILCRLFALTLTALCKWPVQFSCWSTLRYYL